MSAEYDAFRALLEPLPDTFVINDPTLTPVIPPGKFGLVFYIANGVPTAIGPRDITWDLAIISPVTSMKAAGEDLWDAVNVVLNELEKAKTARWNSATIEPYNDTLWCYSVQVTMYAVNEPEEV
jgi:hypothetical protein